MIKNTITSYFAAANGYTGFRSYFGSIFDRKNFTRVFIIKGGPGTGKSTLMKKVLREFENKSITESVYCSSDPNSLDGAIIEANNKRIAIIDGTAPHEEDTRFPGAVDEIVNLGEAWNEKALEERRKEIFELTVSKKKAYQSAYDILEIAGTVNKKMAAITSSLYVGNDEAMISDEISKYSNISLGRKGVSKLISSFSRYGYKRISTNACDNVSIIGRYGSEHIFLSNLMNYLSRTSIGYSVLHSPFSDDIIEGLYIHDSDTLYLAGGDGERIINTSRFLDDSNEVKQKPILEKYRSIYNDLLEMARRELETASDSHFKLEEIYTAAVDFETINRITESLINEIKFIFYK